MRLLRAALLPLAAAAAGSLVTLLLLPVGVSADSAEVSAVGECADGSEAPCWSELDPGRSCTVSGYLAVDHVTAKRVVQDDPDGPVRYVTEIVAVPREVPPKTYLIHDPARTDPADPSGDPS